VWEGGDLAQVREDALLAVVRLGLKREDGELILKALPESLTAAAVALDRDVGHQKPVEELLVDVNRSLLDMTQNYEKAMRRLEQLIAEKENLALELRAANERLELLASQDSLTGLANKRAFQSALERDLARAERDRTFVSLVIADVDFFKKVNDRYGHPVGDEVLKRVAGALTSRLRAGDLATRWGGEEFAIILPGTNALGARIVADRLRKAVEELELFSVQGPFRVTSSFGTATVCGPGCAGRSPDLVERADHALYAAKQAGRNRVMSAPDPAPE
jgi:diguanylate cyclase (GGDEF)-like protein